MTTLENLNNLNNLISYELGLYEKLRDFYAEKKKILIASKVDELCAIDDEILKLTDEIKSALNHRRTFCKGLGRENICLSDLEVEAKTLDKALADEFREKKQQTKTLIEEIKKQEKSSLELIRHGINIVNKTLNLITNKTAVPVAGEYDSSGKASPNGLMQMSLVSEEV